MKKKEVKTSENAIAKSKGTPKTQKKRTYKKKEKYPEHLPSLWGKYGYLNMPLF